MLRLSVSLWILWLLQTGASSDDDVSGCQRRPCQNGGVCQSHNGGFRCLCSRQRQHGVLYGGATCSTALSGCDGNQCENGGVCSALLRDGAHTYRCVCPAGFTGPTCQTSTVFSFESEGYVRVGGPLPDPEAPLNVTFGFRSARPFGTLLQRQVGNLLLSIELLDGRLRLWSRRGRGPGALVQELPESLSSSRWYVVAASLGAAGSFIRLVCPEGGCTSDPATDLQQLEPPSGPPAPGASHQSLTLGAAGGLWGSGSAPGEVDRPPAFLGCFRDVLVGPRLVLPGGPDAPTNVTAGCSDRDRCEEGPCQNRGRCLSRGWRSYTCKCHRPYEGRNCEEEYITARFGNQDPQSYAVFSLDDDPGDALTVSMFIRTRRPGGLLLVLANSTGQYLRLWLEGGRVRVQVNNLETLAGRGVVSDGHFHLVTVRLAAGEAELFQSTQSQGSVPIRPVQAQPGDLVSVGGLPQPRATAAFGGYFRGCVQDLRLNHKRLQFYPTATRVESYTLERLVNVQQGCSSSDACTVNPCLHGGACYSVWDSFVCSCPPNTAGQRCEEVRWCELSPCPTTAECQPRPQGFECLSNVTFGVESSVLRFRSNGRIKRRLCSISLSVRTRRPDTILLHGQRGRDRLTVSLLDSRLVVELHAGAGRDPPRVTIQSRRPLSDGEWHTVELRMEDWTRPQSRWIMAVDSGEQDLTISQAAAGNLDFLGEGADLFLGGRGPDAGLTLSGCLGPVEIGGLLLPVHHDSELNLPRPQEERFERMSSGPNPPYGCRGSRVCEPNPCRNQGMCDDLFDLHRCSCPSAWTGPLCEASTDACVSHPCLHGNCTDLPGGSQCVCEPGYAGDRCEAVVDACENSYCDNGSTCLKGVESYSCLCPQNATGQYCDEKIPDVPWYIEINPLPQLPVSTCAGTKRNYSCFHGGNCSETDSSCFCRPGFTGQWCEKDVDECASDPCMNGGFCINYVNSFECVCDMNYSGTHCQMDVSDFYLYVFLGLWQNLFQLMSYLLIRLDDEPEVDWGFYVND